MPVVGTFSLPFDACLSKGTRQEHSGKCTIQLRVDAFDSQGSWGILQHAGNMVKNCIPWIIACQSQDCAIHHQILGLRGQKLNNHRVVSTTKGVGSDRAKHFHA